MKLGKIWAYGILICAVPVLHAAGPPGKLDPLHTELELGIIATSGNTDSTALKAKATINQDFASWRNKYQLDTLYKESEYNGVSEDTAQRVFVSAQSDYKLSEEHTSLFVYGSYTDDRLSGFDYQSTVSVGYSARAYEDEKSLLKYSVGPGYSFSKTDTGEKDESAIVHISTDYLYHLSRRAKFSQFFSTEAALESDKNTQFKSETAISANIRDDLSMKAAYSVTHNTKVSEGNAKTDAITSVTLAYTF
ncbi:hypothetical protein GCM10027340_15110 [Marinomonas epiphytica]